MQALIGACLFQCAMLGVLVNCSSVLFSQIRQELDLSMTKVTAFNTVQSMTSMLLAACVTGLFFKKNKAKILLLGQVGLVLSYVLLIFGKKDWIWYGAAMVKGMSLCLSTVAVPFVLSQWFPKGTGTVTGIAMAFSGIGGAVCSPLCARLILLTGWEMTVLLLGAVTLLLTVPGLFLMFRNVPGESEMLPEKGQDTEKAGDLKNIQKDFFLLVLLFLAGCVGLQFAYNISIYAGNIGYSLTEGAAMASLLMAGNVASKFVYGFLCDRVGPWKATTIGLGCMGAAMLCFIFAQDCLPVLLGASMVYGFVYAITAISASRCCAAAYGEGESKRMLGIHTGINNAVMAAASLLTGAMIDRSGNFTSVLVLILGALLVSLTAAALLGHKKAENDRK